MSYNIQKDGQRVIVAGNSAGDSCASATTAGYADSAHALRTYSSVGTSHGTSWLMQCQHNLTGNDLFRIYCGDGSVGVSVNHADSVSSISNTQVTGALGYIPSKLTTIMGTLNAGSTSLTLTDAVITTNSCVEVFTNVYGVSPTGISVEAGVIVLTFPAQPGNITVLARVQ